MSLSNETIDLTERERQGAEWNARSRERENVSPPDIQTKSKSAQGKDRQSLQTVGKR